MKRISALIALVMALLGGASPAAAATYFVNSNQGRDAYSGTSAVAAGGAAGPWQTLARLASAKLVPGDVVYLACEGVWNETLRISSSGTAQAPIAILAGPGPCSTAPLIDGAVTIPSAAWVKHSGSIYRAQVPGDLIANSALSSSIQGWTRWAAAGDAIQALDLACPGAPAPCMAFTSGSGNSIAISNNFAIAGGVEYAVSAQVRAPVGTLLKGVVRRGGPTYENLAPNQFVVASGTWQTLAFTFRGPLAVANARFDIEVPPANIKVHLREVHVQRQTIPANVLGAYVDGLAIRRAHHPNFSPGSNGDSPYASIASAGGKTKLDACGLALPPGAALLAGLGVTMRTIDWAIEERTVAAVAGANLTLSAPTGYDIQPGYGFFLTGALWMLDSPGEWFYDGATATAYVWMPAGAAPADRVAIGTLGVGVDLGGKAYVQVDGIAVRHVDTGVALKSGSQLSLDNVSIGDTVGYGINADSCVACVVGNSAVERSGLDAVTANGGAANRFSLTDSRIADAGGSARSDDWRTLPRPAGAAVFSLGGQSSILRNTISGSAHVGIWFGQQAIVNGNYVGDSCRLLNDCGAIYGNYRGNNAVVAGNVIETATGNLAGLPATRPKHTVGIYLDDRNVGSTVEGNTITGAVYGIQMHNSSDATISDNVVFGNSRQQIWMQEHSMIVRGAGDVFGNHLLSNLLVPTGSGPALYLDSEIGDTADFSTFTGNHYSALMTPRVIGERSPTGGKSYNSAEWQASGRESGAHFTEVAGYASFLAGAGNLMPNGNLANGRVGWTWWNLDWPKATTALLNCGFAACLELTAGASATLMSSPNFSVTAGQWYRVSFDAMTSTEGQAINVIVRRGGGGTVGYEYLMPADESFSGSTAWRRYSFAFQASKTITAGDPVTKELGARVDFIRVQPNTRLTVARLEMTTLTPVQAALQIWLLLNRNKTATSLDCAVLAVDPALCSSFYYLSDGSQVAWPASIAALSGRPIYTRDAGLLDSDSDGIADQQDFCPNTAPGSAVNARGCAFNQ